MKKNLSGQSLFRGLLVTFVIFLWGILIPKKELQVDSLFCYTRDSYGNKALMKDDGRVEVEDVFILEIPLEKKQGEDSLTLTVIMEDEKGRKEVKCIEVIPK